MQCTAELSSESECTQLFANTDISQANNIQTLYGILKIHTMYILSATIQWLLSVYSHYTSTLGRKLQVFNIYV